MSKDGVFTPVKSPVLSKKGTPILGYDQSNASFDSNSSTPETNVSFGSVFPDLKGRKSQAFSEKMSTIEEKENRHRMDNTMMTEDYDKFLQEEGSERSLSPKGRKSASPGIMNKLFGDFEFEEKEIEEEEEEFENRRILKRKSICLLPSSALSVTTSAASEEEKEDDEDNLTVRSDAMEELRNELDENERNSSTPGRNKRRRRTVSPSMLEALDNDIQDTLLVEPNSASSSFAQKNLKSNDGKILQKVDLDSTHDAEAFLEVFSQQHQLKEEQEMAENEKVNVRFSFATPPKVMLSSENEQEPGSTVKLRGVLSSRKFRSVQRESSGRKSRVTFGSPQEAEFDFREPVLEGVTPIKSASKRKSLMQKVSVVNDNVNDETLDFGDDPELDEEKEDELDDEDEFKEEIEELKTAARTSSMNLQEKFDTLSEHDKTEESAFFRELREENLSDNEDDVTSFDADKSLEELNILKEMSSSLETDGDEEDFKENENFNTMASFDEESRMDTTCGRINSGFFDSSGEHDQSSHEEAMDASMVSFSDISNMSDLKSATKSIASSQQSQSERKSESSASTSRVSLIRDSLGSQLTSNNLTLPRLNFLAENVENEVEESIIEDEPTPVVSHTQTKILSKTSPKKHESAMIDEIVTPDSPEVAETVVAAQSPPHIQKVEPNKVEEPQMKSPVAEANGRIDLDIKQDEVATLRETSPTVVPSPQPAAMVVERSVQSSIVVSENESDEEVEPSPEVVADLNLNHFVETEESVFEFNGHQITGGLYSLDKNKAEPYLTHDEELECFKSLTSYFEGPQQFLKNGFKERCGCSPTELHNLYIMDADIGFPAFEYFFFKLQKMLLQKFSADVRKCDEMIGKLKQVEEIVDHAFSNEFNLVVGFSRTQLFFEQYSCNVQKRVGNIVFVALDLFTLQIQKVVVEAKNSKVPEYRNALREKSLHFCMTNLEDQLSLEVSNKADNLAALGVFLKGVKEQHNTSVLL